MILLFCSYERKTNKNGRIFVITFIKIDNTVLSCRHKMRSKTLLVNFNFILPAALVTWANTYFYYFMLCFFSTED